MNGYVADNGTVPGCPEKRSFCSSKPCKNGGICIEKWAMYHCLCQEGFGGKDCGRVINKPWRFSGDGTLSFNPLVKQIQLPWLNALSVRTLQSDAFLLSIEIGLNSTSVISLKSGLLQYTYNGESFNLSSKSLADGQWHHIEVTWIGTEIKLSTDYGDYSTLLSFSPKLGSTPKIGGLYVGKILIGGPDNTYNSLNAGYNYLDGCIEDVRIGNYQMSSSTPTVRDNVYDGCSPVNDCQIECPSAATCVTGWGDSICECKSGHVGPLCVPVCDVNPCEHNSVCLEDTDDRRGYRCDCNATEYSGDYCENERSQPCPSSWWGYPVCGPCHCDVDAGYNPDCDKTTGQCYCRENHYQPKDSSQCIPCDCYLTGSYSPQCNPETGQCRCRDGVIGQKCDACPNPYAEITLRGCEGKYYNTYSRQLFSIVRNIYSHE